MDQNLLAAFEQHKEELLNFIKKRVPAADLADDLLHDLYLKLANVDSSNTRVEPIKAPRAYLFRGANNMIADHFRGQARLEKKHEASVDASQPDQDYRSPEHIALQRERLSIIDNAIQSLPAKCQEVFRLRRFEQLDKADIASQLDISTNMVEKHLRKALEHCQQVLDDSLE